MVSRALAGAIGAVVARFVHTEEVTGSNPVSPTQTGSPVRDRVVARLCRSHRRGHWFEPSIAHPNRQSRAGRSGSAALPLTPKRSLVRTQYRPPKRLIRDA